MTQEPKNPFLTAIEGRARLSVLAAALDAIGRQNPEAAAVQGAAGVNVSRMPAHDIRAGQAYDLWLAVEALARSQCAAIRAADAPGTGTDDTLPVPGAA